MAKDIIELHGPVRCSDDVSGAGQRVSDDEAGLDRGRSLEALLDFVQLFGAVSLSDAVLGMYTIALDAPLAFIGVGFIISFLSISTLHAIGGALEVFEGEYTRNWAVLGISWTSNFGGLMLYLTINLARGSASIPYTSLVAPVFQTGILIYLLFKNGGRTKHVRNILMIVTIAGMVTGAIYTAYWTPIEERCDNISLYESTTRGSADLQIKMRTTLYISDACWDLSGMAGFDRIQVFDSDSSEVSTFEKETQTSSSDNDFEITSTFPLTFSIQATSTILLGTAALGCLTLIGGSFAIVVMRPTINKAPRFRCLLTVFVVFGWFVIYPFFELHRIYPRLRHWFLSLRGHCVEGSYTLLPDGRIDLQDGQGRRDLHRLGTSISVDDGPCG